MPPTSAPLYVTPRGLAALRARLDSARAAYKRVCDDNPAARESGDSSVWHDNFAFEENQRLMHQLAARIRALENELDRLVVVARPEAEPRRAVVGTCITYRRDDETTSRRCVLVGHGEGRPERREVAYDSPLGACLLGVTVGDEVEIPVGGVVRRATIEAIELAPAEVFFEASESPNPAPETER